MSMSTGSHQKQHMLEATVAAQRLKISAPFFTLIALTMCLPLISVKTIFLALFTPAAAQEHC
jgi:hypothetical protein